MIDGEYPYLAPVRSLARGRDGIIMWFIGEMTMADLARKVTIHCLVT